MKKLLYNWRYFSLKPAEYKECMKRMFINNLFILRQVNIVVAIMAFSFAIYPLVFERNNNKAMYYIAAAAMAILICLFVNYKNKQHKRGNHVSNSLIYVIIVIYFINVMFFGIYLGVWANPGKLAVSFMVILICALVLFNLPSVFNLLLIISALIAFMTATINIKAPEDWAIDVVNAMFAGAIGIFITWRITVYRMSLASTAIKLEDENTIDPLTQLKNRKDFMQTLLRCLSNYRKSDDLLCLGLLDVDLFKNYNEHYGLPKGDECLRNIGKALDVIRKNMSIYAARIGGNRFALLWFEDNIDKINEVTSIINQMIRDLNIPHERSSIAPYVTVSIGLNYAKCGAVKNVQAIFDLADKALFAAKSRGRDRAVITSSE